MRPNDLSDEQFEDAVSQMLHRRAADIDDAAVVPIARKSAPSGPVRPVHAGRLVFAAAAIAVVVAGLVFWTNRSTQGAITVTEEPALPAIPEPSALAEQAPGLPAPSIVYSADGAVLFDFAADTELVEVPFDPDEPTLDGGTEGPFFMGAEVVGGTDDFRVELVRRLLMGCDAHADPGLAAQIAERGRPFFGPRSACGLQVGEVDAGQPLDPFGDGLRIFTTFDSAAQTAALAAIDSGLPDDPRGFGMTIVSVEPDSGAVRTLASQPGLDAFPLGLATALPGRQPGSAYKTVVVAAALDEGLLPDDQFDGRGPCTLPAPGQPSGEYTVENFGGSSGSINTMTGLTLSSSNCGALAISQVVGLEDVVDVGERLGLGQGDRTAGSLPLSIPLGTREQTPLSMAVMQATLTNAGVRHDPFVIERIETADGEVLYEHEPAGIVAVRPDAACRTIEILAANVRAGTGTAARQARVTAAGKTGTTEDFHDAWFVGSTSLLATAVWMGLPQTINVGSGEGSMRNVGGLASVTGGSYPAQAWGAFNSAYTDASGSAAPDFSECPTPTRGGRFYAVESMEVDGPG